MKALLITFGLTATTLLQACTTQETILNGPATIKVSQTIQSAGPVSAPSPFQSPGVVIVGAPSPVPPPYWGQPCW